MANHDIGIPLRADWPLTGRDEVIERLCAIVEEQAAGGLVLVGSPGVGKTRLAVAAMIKLLSLGYRPLWASATLAAAAVPLGALLHLMRGNGLRTRDPLQTFAHLADQIASGRNRRPVLVIDDGHLLDLTSAALVHHLVRHRGVFTIMTFRSGDSVPDAMTALWKENVVQRIDLPPLSDHDIDALLSSVLDGPMDAVSRRTLRTWSAGNPLVLHEIMDAAMATSTLRHVDGIWHLSGDLPVTTRFCDVLETQIRVPDASVRAVLDVLACSGPLSYPLLEAVTGARAMADAERCGLVIATRQGSRLQLDLPIPAYGGVVLARLPHARAREIWRDLSKAASQLPARRADDALMRAIWRLNAGSATTADLLLTASRRAVARLTLDVAERLVRAARDAGGGYAADLSLAEIFALQGRYHRAEVVLPRPGPHWRPQDLERFTSVGEKIWHARSIESTAGVDGPPAYLVAAADTERMAAIRQAGRAWSNLLSGGVTEALEDTLGLLETAQRLPAPAAVWAAMTAIVAAGLTGQAEPAERIGKIGLAIAAEHKDVLPWAETQVAGARCITSMLTDSPATAMRCADEGYRQACASLSAPYVGVWAAVRGMVAKAQGRARTARTALQEAAVLLRGQRDLSWFRRLFMAELAGVYAMADDPLAAVSWLRRSDELGGASGGLLDAWIERDRAWIAAAESDYESALIKVVKAADLAQATGQSTVAALALFDAVRFAELPRRHEYVDRLNELARQGMTSMIESLSRAATAIADGDPTSLEDLIVSLGSRGHILPAAECAIAAYRRHVESGERSRARAALIRARELLADCEGARTPLTHLVGAPDGLTRRESHVAKLAAAGLTDRIIAERLGLSIRTVSNHLGRVYVKLGVSGRGDLAAIFHLGVRA